MFGGRRSLRGQCGIFWVFRWICELKIEYNCTKRDPLLQCKNVKYNCDVLTNVDATRT